MREVLLHDNVTLKAKNDRVYKNCSLYADLNNKQYIFYGMPYEDDGHNCDVMGCSSVDHVLVIVGEGKQ